MRNKLSLNLIIKSGFYLFVIFTWHSCNYTQNHKVKNAVNKQEYKSLDISQYDLKRVTISGIGEIFIPKKTKLKWIIYNQDDSTLSINFTSTPMLVNRNISFFSSLKISVSYIESSLVNELNEVFLKNKKDILSSEVHDVIKVKDTKKELIAILIDKEDYYFRIIQKSNVKYNEKNFTFSQTLYYASKVKKQFDIEQLKKTEQVLLGKNTIYKFLPTFLNYLECQ